MSTNTSESSEFSTDWTVAPSDGKCVDETGVQDWYEKLREEVDFRCSFCEGLHIHISELEVKVKEAYVATARSMRGVYDQKEIATRWMGMWSFAAEILAIAQMVKESNQICGADLTEIEKYYAASLERYSIHCPHMPCP
jgi:hypothetical protein